MYVLVKYMIFLEKEHATKCKIVKIHELTDLNEMFSDIVDVKIIKND